MSREREEELGLKRCAAASSIEVDEKGIFAIVEDATRIEPRGETLGQCGLANAHRAFDGEVAEVHSGAEYSQTRCATIRRCRTTVVFAPSRS